MKKIHLAICGILVFGGLRCLAEDFTVEGNLNVTSNLTSQSFSSLGAAVGLLIVEDDAVMNGPLTVSGPISGNGSGLTNLNVLGSLPVNSITSDKLATGAITATKLAANSVGATAIASSAVTSAKLAANSVGATAIASGAVTSAKLAANSVGSTAIASGAVTSAKLAANSVGSTAIASGAVTSVKLAANSVGTSAIISNAVTSVKIADGAVTASKLAVGSVGTNNAVQSEWNAWARAQVPAQTQQVYVATAGTAGTVTGNQSNTIATALQPSSITGLVPYVGAYRSVDLGTNTLSVTGLSSLGQTKLATTGGSVLIGATTNDGINKLQVNGSIASISTDPSYTDIKTKVFHGGLKIYKEDSSLIPAGLQYDTANGILDCSINVPQWGEGEDVSKVGGIIRFDTRNLTGANGFYVYGYGKDVGRSQRYLFYVNANDGTTWLAKNGGNVLIGTGTDNAVNKLQVNGSVSATSFVGNGASLSGVVKTSDTNGWTVSAHGAWITAAQVPAQTQQVYVATAGTAGAVTGVQSQLLSSALQPSSITNLVPYTGAASSVDLGTNSMTAKLFIGDGSGLMNLNSSTFATGSITSDKLAIGAVTAEKLAVGSVGTNNAVQSEWNAWVRAQVPAQTQQVYVATAGTAETVTGIQSQLLASALQPVSINNLVPYTGATSSVNFGTNSITAGAFSGDGSGLTDIESATTVTGSQSNTIETVDIMSNALGKMLTVRGFLTNDIASSQPYPIDIPTNMPVMYAAVATGSDANDGFTWGTAKQSIQAAIDVIGTNGVIYVDAGVYTPITVLSNREVYVVSVFGPSVTSINGQGTNRCATLYRDFTDGYTLYTNAALIGFTLINGIISPSYPDLPYDGDWGGAVEGGRLYNCIITGCGASRAVLYVTLANRTYFENCLIYSNNINVYQSSYFMANCVLVNSVVADNITSGPFTKTLAGGYVYNSIIKNNVCGSSIKAFYVDFYRSVSDITGTASTFNDGSILNPGTPIVFTNGYWLGDDSTYLSFGNTAYATATTDLARGPRNLLEGGSCSIGCYEGPYKAAKRTYIDDPNMTALDRLLQSYERGIDSVTKREAVTEARISTNDQQISSIANRVSGIESRTNAYETTVTRAATALQPPSTNGWTVSAHDAWITAAQVPAQTQQVYVATAGTAGAVTGVQSQLVATAWQNPASATNWTWTSNGKEITITNYTGSGGDVVIPEMLDGLPVTTLKDGIVFVHPGFMGGPTTFTYAGPFIGRTNITYVVGRSIRNVGADSFYRCSNLTGIDLPNAEFVGGGAFAECAALTSVSFLNVVTLGAEIFRDSTNMVSVTWGGNKPTLQTLPENAYLGITANQVTNYVTNPTATGWGATFGGMPVVRLNIYGNVQGNATTATTVTGSQSNTMASALQPAQTNGWTVSSHSGLATTGQLSGYLPLAGGLMGIRSSITFQAQYYECKVGEDLGSFKIVNITPGGTVKLRIQDDAYGEFTLATREWTATQYASTSHTNDATAHASLFAGKLDKTSTNGWTVSAHGAWITAAQVPAQTQQVYVATAGAAGIVTGAQSQLLATALQPAAITNLVPYIGAASSVNLGTNSMTAKLFIGDGSGLTNLSSSIPAPGSITSDKLAVGAVTAANLGAGSVGSSALAFNAVTTEKVAEGAVTGGKIASGVINSEHLAEGSVTVAKLAISSNLNMNGNRVTNLALPANDGDATSKAYLRAVLSAIPPQGDLSMGSFTNGAPASFPLSF